MNQEKYIGMDVHDASISAAVINAQGKVLTQCVMETKASTILEFIQGLRGTLAVTFEEGTLAAWLHVDHGLRTKRVVSQFQLTEHAVRDGYRLGSFSL